MGSFLSYLTDLLTKIDQHLHGGQDQKRAINCLLGIFMLEDCKVNWRDMHGSPLFCGCRWELSKALEIRDSILCTWVYMSAYLKSSIMLRQWLRLHINVSILLPSSPPQIYSPLFSYHRFPNDASVDRKPQSFFINGCCDFSPLSFHWHSIYWLRMLGESEYSLHNAWLLGMGTSSSFVIKNSVYKQG